MPASRSDCRGMSREVSELSMIRRVAASAGSARSPARARLPFMPGIFMSISARSYGVPCAGPSRSMASAQSAAIGGGARHAAGDDVALEDRAVGRVVLDDQHAQSGQVACRDIGARRGLAESRTSR